MTGQMSEEQKSSMADGRVQNNIVRLYLNALKSKRAPGRRRTVESISVRITKLATQLDEGFDDIVAELAARQEIRDLIADREKLIAETPIEVLTKNFVTIAAGYSARKGIAYETWRDMGVPADVLEEAQIRRHA